MDCLMTTILAASSERVDTALWTVLILKINDVCARHFEPNSILAAR